MSRLVNSILQWVPSSSLTFQANLYPITCKQLSSPDDLKDGLAFVDILTYL